MDEQEQDLIPFECVSDDAMAYTIDIRIFPTKNPLADTAGEVMQLLQAMHWLIRQTFPPEVEARRFMLHPRWAKIIAEYLDGKVTVRSPQFEPIEEVSPEEKESLSRVIEEDVLEELFMYGVRVVFAAEIEERELRLEKRSGNRRAGDVLETVQHW